MNQKTLYQTLVDVHTVRFIDEKIVLLFSDLH
jgi:hypothetical protein